MSVLIDSRVMFLAFLIEKANLAFLIFLSVNMLIEQHIAAVLGKNDD